MPQCGVERKARQRDAVAAAPQVDGRVLQHAPPHFPLACDDLGQTRLGGMRDAVLDVHSGVVVARDRHDSVRCAQAAQQAHGAGVQLRTADIDQIAAEDDEVGMQAVDAVRDAAQLRFGADERAEVDVRELDDAETVESRGNPFGAYFGAADADLRPAPRGAPDQERGHADAGGDAGVRQADEPEEIAGDARQDGDHPYPERPHGEEHESRGVVAAQGVGQGDDRRQGVGGGGQRDEQAQVACGGSAPPQPAVVYDVCGCGRERQNRNKPEKHTLF